MVVHSRAGEFLPLVTVMFMLDAGCTPCLINYKPVFHSRRRNVDGVSWWHNEYDFECHSGRRLRPPAFCAPRSTNLFFGGGGVKTARTRSWLSIPLSFEVKMYVLLGEPVFANSWGGAKHGCNVLIYWDSRIRCTVNFIEELPDRWVTTLT
jgi:hypothetical protein